MIPSNFFVSLVHASPPRRGRSPGTYVFCRISLHIWQKWGENNGTASHNIRSRTKMIPSNFFVSLVHASPPRRGRSPGSLLFRCISLLNQQSGDEKRHVLTQHNTAHENHFLQLFHERRPRKSAPAWAKSGHCVYSLHFLDISTKCG